MTLNPSVPPFIGNLATRVARFLLFQHASFHFARSGERELGAIYSQRAAASAFRSSAPQEALTHYRTALALLDEHAPQRGTCLLGLGEAARLCGTLQDASEAFVSALEWWRARGNNGEAGRAALGLGRVYWRREEIAPARTALQQAVALLSEKPGAEMVQALIELGSLLALSLHEFTEASDALNQALTFARQFGDARLEAAASRRLGVWYSGQGMQMVPFGCWSRRS